MSHTTKSGAARSLVVLGAVALVAPLSQAQQITKPLSSIGASPMAAKVSCHGITNVPMTADAEQTLPLRLVANLPCGQELSVLSDFDAYTVAVRTPEGVTGYVARIYLAASSKAPSRQASAAPSARPRTPSSPGCGWSGPGNCSPSPAGR